MTKIIHVVNKRGNSLTSEQDNISYAREVYNDSHEYVPITFEMTDEEALEAFYDLPENVLPSNLPSQYRWVLKGTKHCIAKITSADDHDLKIVLYGPDKKTGKVNFIFIVNDVTVYSLAHIQRPSKDPKRTYPSGLDFRVPDFAYNEHQYSSHVKGHMIDHADTICVGQREYWSTYDRRNYTPEPPDYDWGLGIRNLKVKDLRKNGGGAYAQLNYYTDTPDKTVDGTLVPEEVRFHTFSLRNYKESEIYHVEFSENFKRPKGTKVLEHASEKFTTSVESSPIVKMYDPEASDRALRLMARNEEKRSLSIKNGDVHSRFQDKDSILASLSSADLEFETTSRKFGAGVLAGKKGKSTIATNYIQHGLFSAEKLLESEDYKDCFTPEDKKLTVRYLRKRTDDASDDEDCDAMIDRMNQLGI